MKMNTIKPLLLTAVFIAVFFLTGCWDNYDVSEIAIVTAIGIDRSENGLWSVTWQILKPDAANPGIEGGQSGKAYTNYTGTGLTLNEAHKELILYSGRKPFYGHVQVILIGESLAKEGIVEALDLFERQYEFNQKVKMLLTKDMKAAELLDAESDLEDLPAAHLSTLIDANKFTGKVIDLSFYKLIMELESYGKSTVISALSSQKTEEKTTTTIKSMQMDHAGIFKEGRLVGYIDSTQVQSYLLITNPNLRETLFTIKHPKSPETYISLEIMRGEAKREIKLEGNRLKGTITVSLLARIADVHESRFPLDPDTFDEIENALSVYIKNNLTNLIDDLQNRFGTDAIGFGQIVYKKEHNFWKNLEDDWDAYFIQMPIYVNVNVHIKRTGFITKPSEAR